jgi:transposase
MQKCFWDAFSPLALRLLYAYPTSQEVLQIDSNTLAREMYELGGKRSYSWCFEKAERLRKAAMRNPFKEILYKSHLISLRMYINMLLQHKKSLLVLESEIDKLAKEFEEYNIIRSIPGIGAKITATLISEIGEVKQFSNPKKLVAYAGIDPRIFQSGRFQASINRITKRGSTRLRQALYTAVQCGLRKNRNVRLREFYDKKRSEGKPHKVAIIACVNKLLHWIYAILTHKEAFKVE